MSIVTFLRYFSPRHVVARIAALVAIGLTIGGLWVLLLGPNSDGTPSADCLQVHVGTLLTAQDQMWKLRELVGSLHAHCEIDVPRVTVFIPMAPSDQIKEEIAIWRNVQIVDPCFALGLVAGESAKGCLVSRQALTSWVQNERFGTVAIFVDLGLVFEAVPGWSSMGTQIVRVGSLQMDIFSLQRDTSGKAPRITAVTEAKKVKKRCLLSVKPMPVPPMLPAANIHTINDQSDTGKVKIAMLIPTKPENDIPFQDTAFFRVMLPSIVASLTREERSKYILYIYLGHDHGDPVYDGPLREQLFQKLHSLIQGAPVVIRVIRLPCVHWLTYLWNALFVYAYFDGADYFYQLGDDIKFGDAGWASTFHARLRSLNNIGVIAPNDTRWSCKLFTQSFVSRTHYDLFGGQYFPLELRDWYSDNWITQVYPHSKRHCFLEHRISNTSTKERYTPCDASKMYADIVARYQQVFL